MQVVFIVLTAVCLVLSFRFLNRARQLRAIPRAKIRSAPQGYVELKGRARAIVPVPYYAPGTNRRCVWFECRYRENNDDGERDVVKCTEQSFLIEDNTGACRIDPLTMRILPKSKLSTTLSRLGISQVAGIGTVRWIAVGEQIHAWGKFTSLRSDYGSLREDLIQSRLRALKNDRELMLQFDVDGDGNIDIEEWDSAREFIIKQVDEEIVEKQKQENSDVLGHVLRPPDDPALPYLVSSQTELKAIRRDQLYALGFFLLFLLTGAALVDSYFLGWLSDGIDKFVFG